MDLVLSFIVAIAVIVVLAVFFRFFPIGLWISAAASGVHISIFSMVGMRFRRINPSKVVLPMIKATKAGLQVNMKPILAAEAARAQADDVARRLREANLERLREAVVMSEVLDRPVSLRPRGRRMF